jgi:serine/threonine-protein kinase
MTTDQRIGEYDILTRLSTGGMGEIYLARRTGVHRFEKLAVIKVLRTDRKVSDEHMRTMFQDEARLMARLSHPAIAQVYDFGEDAGRLFLVMEYVSGISFKEFIRRRPPPAVAALAMVEVCMGLHAAHNLTDLSGKPLMVVHRDVSPQNLMLTFDGCVKILDFGIAFMRDRETQATQMGQIKGKPAYMAPEQVTSGPVDERTDLFAASIVLHELLTGRRLFVGDNLYAITQQIMTAEVHPPSAFGLKIPKGLDDLVLCGLERHPDRRFQTALEMARALRAIVDKARGETLEAYAARELTGDRQTHLGWLQQTLSGIDHPPLEQLTAGRPTGVDTSPLDLENVDTEKSLQAGPVPPARSRVRPVMLLLALVLVAGFAAYWFLWRNASPDPADESREVSATVIPDRPARAEDRPMKADPPTPEEPEPVVEEGKPEKPAKRPPKKRRKKKKQGRKEAKSEKLKSGLEPQPPPVQVFGFLTVAADPYANVRIDGKEAGTTPIFRRKLPAGEHLIELVSPDTGRTRLKKTIQLAENEHEKVIDRPGSGGP